MNINKKQTNIDSKWKILLEKYSIYNQLEQKKHLKKFYNTNPRSSTGSAFSVQQSGKRKTGTNP